MTCTAVTQYPNPPSHISAINHYHLNNRPPFSLDPDRKVCHCCRAEPTCSHCGSHCRRKSWKGRGIFPSLMSWSPMVIPTQHRISLQRLTLQLGCSVSFCRSAVLSSCLNCGQLIRSKEQSNSSWIKVTGESRATATLQGTIETTNMTIKQSDTETSTCRCRKLAWLLLQGQIHGRRPYEHWNK